MKERVIEFVLIGAATGLMLSTLGGCAQKSVSIEPTEQTASTGSTAADKPLAPEASLAPASTAKNEGAGPVESLDTPPGQETLKNKDGLTGVVEGTRTSLGLLPVYFEFDKSSIQPAQVERLRANALYLKENPAVRAQIEGNCDDRGSNTYNLALGEYRAMSAKKYLVNLGVPDDRLTTLSYGEERSVNPEQDERGWAENRRDDFVIVQ